MTRFVVIDGKEHPLKLYSWPITNTKADPNKAATLTMELTETAHAAVVTRIGPAARFAQRSKGAALVSTTFGDSHQVYANELFKDACVLMFPLLSSKILDEAIQVEHLLNSTTGLDKKIKFANLANYTLDTIALYTATLNKVVGGGGTKTDSNSTSGISRANLRAQFSLRWLIGAEKNQYRPLKCLVELAKNKHQNHAGAVTLVEVWDEFTTTRLEHYLAEPQIVKYRGSLRFVAAPTGQFTLNIMSDDEISAILRARFAPPTPTQIAQQRAAFIADIKKERADAEEAKQVAGQSKLSFAPAPAPAPAPEPEQGSEIPEQHPEDAPIGELRRYGNWFFTKCVDNARPRTIFRSIKKAHPEIGMDKVIYYSKNKAVHGDAFIPAARLQAGTSVYLSRVDGDEISSSSDDSGEEAPTTVDPPASVARFIDDSAAGPRGKREVEEELPLSGDFIASEGEIFSESSQTPPRKRVKRVTRSPSPWRTGPSWSRNAMGGPM